jgi:tetratricopeptide (TPR) repeat protein
LALLNRLEEAENNLDTAHSLLLKSGHEPRLGRYYHISGVLEFMRGDYSTALDYFEKAEEIAQRFPFGINQNIALLDLARVEIVLDSQSTDNSKSVVSGKWLSNLEQHAVKRDFPGIRMYAALLKSEFYYNNREIRDAQAILQDALEITDSPGVRTLRKKIIQKLDELSHHISEQP